MTNTKKNLVLVAVLAILMALTLMMPVSVYAADASVRIETTSVEEGSQATVKVIYSGENIGRVNANLTYDNTMVSYVSGGSSSGDNGLVSLSGASDGGDIVFNLTFVGIKPGNAEFKINTSEVYDMDEQSMGFPANQASLSIKAIEVQEPEEEEEPPEKEDQTPDDIVAPEKEEGSSNIILYVVIGLLAVAVIALIIVLVVKSRKKNDDDDPDFPDNGGFKAVDDTMVKKTTITGGAKTADMRKFDTVVYPKDEMKPTTNFEDDFIAEIDREIEAEKMEEMAREREAMRQAEIAKMRKAETQTFDNYQGFDMNQVEGLEDEEVLHRRSRRNRK